MNGANMDSFIRYQNVERYRRLLARVTEETGRILKLLAEEQQARLDFDPDRRVAHCLQ
jgi:hypothetical protein